jgi:hypothetical protein
MAGTFSSPGSALGAPYHHVQSVLSCGVPTDYTQEVMKPLLRILRNNDLTLKSSVTQVNDEFHEGKGVSRGIAYKG